MELSTIQYDVCDRVAHVRLARPEGANAVNPAFARELREVMLAIQHDRGVKAVSVTAEGKVFCAGGDLKEFHAAGEGLPHLASGMLVDFHAAIYKMNYKVQYISGAWVVRPQFAAYIHDFQTKHESTAGYENYVDRSEFTAGVDVGYKFMQDTYLVVGYR